MRRPSRIRDHPVVRGIAVGAILLIDFLAALRSKTHAKEREKKTKEKAVAGQPFGPGANRIFRLSIAGAIASVTVVLAVLILLPWSSLETGVNRFVRQPVPFSHEHHVGEIGIDCRFCHREVETSSFAGIPAAQTCMKCHAVLFKDAPMLAPVRESFATGKRLYWNRVYRLPDFVYFDHSIHIAGRVPCQACHGDLGSMPWVRRADAFRMGRCLACHQKAGAYVKGINASGIKGLKECSTCHR